LRRRSKEIRKRRGRGCKKMGKTEKRRKEERGKNQKTIYRRKERVPNENRKRRRIGRSKKVMKNEVKKE
jgi:hypothetical protein